MMVTTTSLKIYFWIAIKYICDLRQTKPSAFTFARNPFIKNP
ncbi:Uncharacterised protein [Mycobacterium tuberculosis]|nr:Uncharacterised protein [Mycobacterium tuberculosis]